jgi:hypothetical protein
MAASACQRIVKACLSLTNSIQIIIQALHTDLVEMLEKLDLHGQIDVCVQVLSGQGKRQVVNAKWLSATIETGVIQPSEREWSRFSRTG